MGANSYSPHRHDSDSDSAEEEIVRYGGYQHSESRYEDFEMWNSPCADAEPGWSDTEEERRSLGRPPKTGRKEEKAKKAEASRQKALEQAARQRKIEAEDRARAAASREVELIRHKAAAEAYRREEVAREADALRRRTMEQAAELRRQEAEKRARETAVVMAEVAARIRADMELEKRKKEVAQALAQEKFNEERRKEDERRNHRNAKAALARQMIEEERRKREKYIKERKAEQGLAKKKADEERREKEEVEQAVEIALRLFEAGRRKKLAEQEELRRQEEADLAEATKRSLQERDIKQEKAAEEAATAEPRAKEEGASRAESTETDSDDEWEKQVAKRAALRAEDAQRMTDEKTARNWRRNAANRSLHDTLDNTDIEKTDRDEKYALSRKDITFDLDETKTVLELLADKMRSDALQDQSLLAQRASGQQATTSPYGLDGVQTSTVRVLTARDHRREYAADQARRDDYDLMILRDEEYRVTAMDQLWHRRSKPAGWSRDCNMI
ncbi:hypothetical protein E4T47_03934 [Aureobasidium subglaciale]|nr:hypothetical protein E4T47_03934 [Aureobasidium subglaciale]